MKIHKRHSSGCFLLVVLTSDFYLIISRHNYKKGESYEIQIISYGCFGGFIWNSYGSRFCNSQLSGHSNRQFILHSCCNRSELCCCNSSGNRHSASNRNYHLYLHQNTPYKLAINAGSGTVAARTMAGTAGNTDKLNYNLYTDNTYSKVWGQTAGTDTVDLTGDGTAQTSTVYGKLDLNQYVKADSTLIT